MPRYIIERVIQTIKKEEVEFPTMAMASEYAAKQGLDYTVRLDDTELRAGDVLSTGKYFYMLCRVWPNGGSWDGHFTLIQLSTGDQYLKKTFKTGNISKATVYLSEIIKTYSEIQWAHGKFVFVGNICDYLKAK